jgi:hypothetical protein
MNNNYFESHTQRGYSRRPSETQRRSYNRFEYLSTEVTNNLNRVTNKEPQKTTWIRKQYQYRNEECIVTLQAKQKKRGWYVDTGCSKHMTGDIDKFLTLRKERDGSVSFGNDDSAEKEQFELGTRMKRQKMFY